MSNIIIDIDNFNNELANLINKYSAKIPASIMNDKLNDLSKILSVRADRQLKEAKEQQKKVEDENDE